MNKLNKSPFRQRQTALPEKNGSITSNDEKLVPPQKVGGQPKNTTLFKNLLVGLLALFLYRIVKMDGLIVAIGLVAYFFCIKSNNQEIELAPEAKSSFCVPNNSSRNVNTPLCSEKPWQEKCMKCRGYQTLNFFPSCKE